MPHQLQQLIEKLVVGFRMGTTADREMVVLGQLCQRPHRHVVAFVAADEAEHRQQDGFGREAELFLGRCRILPGFPLRQTAVLNDMHSTRGHALLDQRSPRGGRVHHSFGV